VSVSDLLERWRGYVELWNGGDFERWWDEVGSRMTFTPDPRFPETGPFEGEELRNFYDQWWEAWGGESRLVVRDLFERSGAVVARCLWDVSGAASGAHMPEEWATFTLVGWSREDGSIETLLGFLDHEEALAAADAGPARR
jgi:hypothetical protein